ncbi:MAG: Fe-S cluster protein [Gammaproteobacteria bacterium]|nr:Fe-S cluster protein [Gammaproteobacteria bacterium]
MIILTAIGVMVAISFILATFLVLANKKLYVHEDLRINLVEEMLPNTNCGACGLPGCRAFAEALVQQKVLPVQCTVSTDEAKLSIADVLGVEVGEQEKQVVRLACAGGDNVARWQAHYTGLPSCRAAAQITGGGKGCWWGCLGFGDCEIACDYNAIVMNSHALPVVIEDKCTACGDCVDVCPKDLFTLHPVSHRLWVACSNLEYGDQILDNCEVACTACDRCVVDSFGLNSSDSLIAMQHNLPVVDYTKNHNTRTPIQRCPTGAIIFIEADGTVIKGPAATKIIRKEALQAAPT